MNPTPATAVWKSVLDACDRLVRACRAAGEDLPPADPSSSAGSLAQLRAEAAAAAASEEIERALRAPARGPRARFEASEGATTTELSAEERLVLALLLQNHLSGRGPSIKGRELLEFLSDSSYERLLWVPRLRPAGALITSGWVSCEAEDRGNEDPLEARFRLSEAFLSRLQQDPNGEAEPAEEPAIGSDAELLVAYRDLTELYAQRAQRLFEREDKGGPAPDANEFERLLPRIDELEEELAELLQAETLPFPSALLGFARRYHLDEEETYCLAFLLLGELLHGEPWQGSSHVLRLLSASEEELWEKRTLLAPQGRLRKEGIVVLEEMIDGRPLSSDVCLATWVVERLTSQLDQAIAPDEKIDFHMYLKDLRDSAPFYRRLGSEATGERGEASDREDRGRDLRA